MNDSQKTTSAPAPQNKHVLIVRPVKGGVDRLTNGCKPDGQRD